MTHLAARLADRQFAFEGTTDPSEPRRTGALSEVPTRASARIIGYSADLSASHCRRLYDLGFAPGARVDVVCQAPARDPWIYRVAGSEIAVRRSLARAILVVR